MVRADPPHAHDMARTSTSGSGLDPVAIDIETTGLDGDGRVTVVGFAHALGAWLALNGDGRVDESSRAELLAGLPTHAGATIELEVAGSERETLERLGAFVGSRLDPDRHYLTAFNGETWRGGFDLPFLRTAHLRHDLSWPFGTLAYADVSEAVVDRFATDGARDLAGVHAALVGDGVDDPFEDSAEAVEAFEAGRWTALLRHNLADVRRTRQLALVAGRFVAKSDFRMKNLEPPDRDG